MRNVNDSGPIRAIASNWWLSVSWHDDRFMCRVMTRQLLLAATLLALVGCSGNTDLTARGHVTANVDGTPRGFSFPNDIRLDAPEPGTGEGLITGTCEMARVEDPVGGDSSWGVVFTLEGGINDSDDNPLTRVTIMQRSDADPAAAYVEAEIDGVTHTSGSGACAIDLEYVTEDSGMVGIAGACDVASDAGDTAAIEVELDIIGCTVLD